MPSDSQPLTDREREVLDLVAEFYTNREIAERLCLAESTVESHVHHILAKLRCRTRNQAARIWKRSMGTMDR
jgi:DNA-binding NarL/FixJ family response regulator